MTWEIFLGIASLLAFVFSIMAVVVKIVRTLTLMEANLKALSASFEESRRKEKERGVRLAARVDRIEKEIAARIARVQ